MDDDDIPPDYGLVAPLAVPPDSRVPERLAEGSDAEEYDLYFRIRREQPGLLHWTRDSLRVEAELLADLETSSLQAEDRCRVLQGLLAINRVTLERWVNAGDAAERSGRGDGDDGD